MNPKLLQDLLMVAPMAALFLISLIPLTIKVLNSNREPKAFFTLIYGFIGLAFAIGLTASIDGTKKTAFSNAIIMDGVSAWGSYLVYGITAVGIMLAYDNFATRGRQFAEFLFLMVSSACGMVVLLMSNDLIVTFIGIETMSLCLYILVAMSKEEIFAEATSVYDNYVEALETGTLEALQAYSRNLSERIIPRGVETHEVVGIVMLLRDVLARSLFAKYQADFDKLNLILDAYEPAANRIAITVSVGFVQERERTIRDQQEAIRELSTPVLQVRERLLILPIIGLIDPQRARQLTEQLLRAIRSNRAKVVVIDITGVAAMDSNVANHLVLTVEASRLLGATVIVTGLSPEISQTLVNIGVDLSKMNTVGDLQGGIEEAERLLGYKVVSVRDVTTADSQI